MKIFNPSLDLHYVNEGQAWNGDNISFTVILLKDPVYPVTVQLGVRSKNERK